MASIAEPLLLDRSAIRAVNFGADDGGFFRTPWGGTWTRGPTGPRSDDIPFRARVAFGEGVKF